MCQKHLSLFPPFPPPQLFEEPDVIGVSLSSRPRDDNLSVWNKDNETNPLAKQRIGYAFFPIVIFYFSRIIF